MIQTLPAFCLQWVNWLFVGASGVLLIATVVALLYVAADLRAKAAAGKALTRDKEAGGGFIEAAQLLVEGLSKAPIWLGLFFCGLILLWIAANEVPKVCRAPQSVAESPDRPPASGTPAAATGGSLQAGPADPESGG